MTKKEMEVRKQVIRDELTTPFWPDEWPVTERLAHTYRMLDACSCRHFGNDSPEETAEMKAYAKEVWEEVYGDGTGEKV